MAAIAPQSSRDRTYLTVLDEAEGDVQMWRTRREMLGAVASLLILMASLGGCLLIIAFSWPDNERRPPVAAFREFPAAVSSVAIVGAEIVPIATETGSIGKARDRR